MAESRVLTTPRLQILPFSEKHITERYLGWLKDPEVVRYSQQRFRSHTLDTCRVYWHSFHGTPNYFWAIERRGTVPAHIGNMNAYVDERHGLADIGIMIGERAVWGKGYGSEAWIAVCHYLLHEAGIRKVTAGTISVNDPMLAVMSRAGMIDDSHRVRHQLWEDQEVDIIYRALFSEDWLKQHPRGPFSE